SLKDLFGVQVDVARNVDQVPLGEAHVEQVFQAGRVSACGAGKAGRLGRLETRLLKSRHQLVLELAQIRAELRLEIRAGDALAVAEQLLGGDEPIDRGVNQG